MRTAIATMISGRTLVTGGCPFSIPDVAYTGLGGARVRRIVTPDCRIARDCEYIGMIDIRNRCCGITDFCNSRSGLTSELMRFGPCSSAISSIQAKNVRRGGASDPASRQCWSGGLALGKGVSASHPSALPIRRALRPGNLGAMTPGPPGPPLNPKRGGLR